MRWLKPQRVIEVGIYIGAGSLHLAQGLADNGHGELHLVDWNQARLIDVESKIRRANLAVPIHTHCGDSIVLGREGKIPKADFIFVDAGHEYAGATQQLAVYSSLLSEGGLMAFHDSILWEGVCRATSDLFGDGRLLFTLASSGGAGVSLISKAAAPASPAAKRDARLVREFL